MLDRTQPGRDAEREPRAPREGSAGTPTIDRTCARGPASSGESASTPRVSVVIPTYNRRRLLVKVLEALARQSTPRGCFEVVVVDDGSADGTADGIGALTLP